MVVDDGTEAETVSPTGGHVDDVDPLVTVGDSPTPGLQCFRPVQGHGAALPSTVSPAHI